VFDVSSGGNHKDQKIPRGSSQSTLSKRVKEIVQGKIIVSAVGGIRDGKTAEHFLQEDRADLILVGRHFQKNPGAVWDFAEDLDTTIYLPSQIGWGYGGRGAATSRKVSKVLGGPTED
jgi:2,4-dienoyl-CoA reductase-like NADH-dependent reductase (Old Yellow Enzyme family)